MVARMWRAIAVFRLVTLVYAVALILRHRHGYAHPLGGPLALAAMAGWTALATVVYARPAPRRRWFVAADALVAVALVLSTRWVDTSLHIDHGAPTLPASWTAASVLACAVSGGPWPGLVGGAAVSAADVAERTTLAPNTFNGVVLLVIMSASPTRSGRRPGARGRGGRRRGPTSWLTTGGWAARWPPCPRPPSHRVREEGTRSFRDTSDDLTMRGRAFWTR